MSWKQQIDLRQPAWQGYLGLLSEFEDTKFPSPETINEELSPGLETSSGGAINFVNSENLGVLENYEQHIFSTGEISTRPGSHHDLFNAFAWVKFPRIKAAINAVHNRELNKSLGVQRSKCRDALTLFDECGILIISSNEQLLGEIARHEWESVYCQQSAEWQESITVFVLGHGLLEKFLNPYKAITAQALLLQADVPAGVVSRAATAVLADHAVAAAINAGQLLETSQSRSAVPLAGIPGWWPDEKQNVAFYDDLDVFRPLGSRREPAPIHKLTGVRRTGPAD